MWYVSMGASFSLPFLSAETGAAFDKLPEELLMRVVRTLLRDDPQAVCRLVSASRVLRQVLLHTRRIQGSTRRRHPRLARQSPRRSMRGTNPSARAEVPYSTP